MDTGHYVNLPEGGSKVFRVVGVSFGLLCIIQSALNVSLRLQGFGFCNKSGHIYSTNVTLISTADVSTQLLEKDRLAQELQANNNRLTRDNEMLQGQITELQTEQERLINRLSELEHKSPNCSLGWMPYMSSCYQLSTERNDWGYARKDCLGKGAHLVILNNKMEEKVLHTFGSSRVWIGLSANQRDGLKKWSWVDERPLIPANRIQPQPDDRRFYCAYSEVPPFGSVTWISASCREQHHWVCEKECACV